MTDSLSISGSTISISLSAAPRPAPPPASRPPFGGSAAASRGRPSAALDHDSSDGSEDDEPASAHAVTTFDASRGGALSGRREEVRRGPLVIPSAKNRDWRAEAERRRRKAGGKGGHLPPEAYARGEKEGGGGAEVDNTGEGEKYGLQVFERRQQQGETTAGGGEGMEVDEEGEGGPAAEQQQQPQPKTEEELALEALLHGDKPKNTLVLAAVTQNVDWRTASLESREEDAYKQDVASRPDVPTLDEYEAVPVHEFGAALLRGMGWKEGQELGKNRRPAAAKLRTLEKRPAFLGIGAKPKEDVPELGTWGKADKKRKGNNRRPDTTYVPVLLVDRRTGLPVDNEPASHASAREDSSRGRSSDTRGSQKRGRDRSYDSPDRSRRDRSRDRHHHHARNGSDGRRRDDDRVSRRRDGGRPDGRRDHDGRRHHRDRSYDRHSRR